MSNQRELQLRRGRELNRIECFLKNIFFKEIKWNEKEKKLYLIIEDNFVKAKSVGGSKVKITKLPEPTKINYQLYDRLPGNVTTAYINQENGGLTDIFDDVKQYVETICDVYNEIVIIGKGIGGVIASIMPGAFPDDKRGLLRMITIATPFLGITPFINSYSRKKYVSQKNQLLRQAMWEDYYELAWHYFDGIRHINCVCDSIKKINYMIEKESQELFVEDYTERVRFKVDSIDEATRLMINRLSPELADDEIIVIEL